MSTIAKIALSWEGQEITEFQSFTEKGVKHGDRVPLMGGSEYVEFDAPEYGFELDYVEPREGGFDFEKTKGTPATVTIFYQGGRKRVYRGVRLLEEGDSKLDGKSGKIIPYTFMATKRD